MERMRDTLRLWLSLLRRKVQNVVVFEEGEQKMNDKQKINRDAVREAVEMLNGVVKYYDIHTNTFDAIRAVLPIVQAYLDGKLVEPMSEEEIIRTVDKFTSTWEQSVDCAKAPHRQGGEGETMGIVNQYYCDICGEYAINDKRTKEPIGLYEISPYSHICERCMDKIKLKVLKDKDKNE